ncbi:FAD-dependent oxidoreductase [Streptomyces sp. NPDC058000]|uniref:FAD-dependent oxidoreductase n=1 Tax=Streptomyces sp. NPDC058000 TaxID=3346299 RepID=UPI0036E3CCFE
MLGQQVRLGRSVLVLQHGCGGGTLQLLAGSPRGGSSARPAPVIAHQANAILALRTLDIDIAPGLDKRGEVFDELKFLTKRGRPIRALPFRALADRLGTSNYAVHRADLQQTLLDALGDDQVIELNAAATGFVTGDDGVEVTFEDGRKAAGDVLIGADGFNSAGSRRLGKEEIAGLFAGWADEVREGIRVSAATCWTSSPSPPRARWPTSRPISPSRCRWG